MKIRIETLVAILATAFLALPALGQGTWTTKTSMPTPRGLLAAASINGIVYALGGASDGNCTATSTVEAYDPATDTWTAKAPMPTPRYSLKAVVVNQTLYAIGGGANCNDSGDKATVEAYNPLTDTWTTKASMPVASRDLSANVINGIIYVVGGTYQSAVYAYDPSTDTWTTKAAVTPQRFGGAAAALNGIIYWTSGTDSSVDAYDPVTDTWIRKASSIPNTYSGPGVGVIDDKLYFVGGWWTTEMDTYDPATDTWTTQPPMATSRSPGVAVANGVLYALGGDTTSYNPLATNEAFTPENPYTAQVQQPINLDGSSIFNVRRGVVPVKFTLTQGGVATCDLPPATIAVTRTAGGTTGAIDESVYTGSADTGSNFRIDSCQVHIQSELGCARSGHLSRRHQYRRSGCRQRHLPVEVDDR